MKSQIRKAANHNCFAIQLLRGYDDTTWFDFCRICKKRYNITPRESQKKWNPNKNNMKELRKHVLQKGKYKRLTRL